MKFPLIIISYGAFGADQKKLYFYESEGVTLFPIFTDPVIAAQFQSAHQKIIEEHNDQRKLTTQVCSKPRYARDMLMTISAIMPEITTIIIDPAPPRGLTEEALKAGVIPKNNRQPIEDIIQELEGSISSNASN